MEGIPLAASHAPDKRKGTPKRALIAGIVVLLLAAVGAAVYLHFADPYDPNASSLTEATRSEAEIKAELNEATQRSRLWISVAATATVDSSTDEVSAADADGNAVSVLDNLSSNTRDMKYTFELEDGTIVYESDLIRPGHSIERPKLSHHLEPGTYGVTVLAQGYDAESHAALGGTVSAQITLEVK